MAKSAPKASPAKRLRALINAPDILVLPGVFDGFSTRLVEKMGYTAAFITGSGVSESRLGQPDVGLMGLEENVAAAQMQRRVRINSHLRPFTGRHAPATRSTFSKIGRASCRE